jgi:hypothetical protein
MDFIRSTSYEIHTLMRCGEVSNENTGAPPIEMTSLHCIVIYTET